MDRPLKRRQRLQLLVLQEIVERKVEERYRVERQAVRKLDGQRASATMKRESWK